MFLCDDDEVDHRLDLGLAGRIVAGADLLVLLAPARREVAVQVEAFEVGIDLDRQAVVVPDQALGHQPVVLAAELAGLARDHKARILLALLPSAVRIGDAHEEDPAVAVDVLGGQALDRLLVEWITARRRADVARPVGERELGAVGIEARAQIDRARVEQLRDLGVGAVFCEQLVQEIEHRRRRRQLGGVDVAVGPERRLVLGGAGRDVGDRRDPDVAPFEALADRADRRQGRKRLRVFEQQLGQLVVPVEDVEVRRRVVGGRHGAAVSGDRLGCIVSAARGRAAA